MSVVTTTMKHALKNGAVYRPPLLIHWQRIHVSTKRDSRPVAKSSTDNAHNARLPNAGMNFDTKTAQKRSNKLGRPMLPEGDLGLAVNHVSPYSHVGS